MDLFPNLTLSKYEIPMMLSGVFWLNEDYSWHDVLFEVVPIGMLVFCVVHHYIPVSDQVIDGCRISQVCLFSEMLGQVLFGSMDAGGSRVKHFPHLEDERKLGHQCQPSCRLYGKASMKRFWPHSCSLMAQHSVLDSK